MPSTDHVGGDNLVIDNVYFSYGDGPIFNGLNIDVTPGEFLSIIGPSGCGKTTLLNLLSGFLCPDQGNVALRGRPIAPEDPHFGYVFQSATLFPWLTTVENVEFGLDMEGKLSAKEKRKKALHFLELVGLKAPERIAGIATRELGLIMPDYRHTVVIP